MRARTNVTDRSTPNALSVAFGDDSITSSSSKNAFASSGRTFAYSSIAAGTSRTRAQDFKPSDIDSAAPAAPASVRGASTSMINVGRATMLVYLARPANTALPQRDNRSSGDARTRFMIPSATSSRQLYGSRRVLALDDSVDYGSQPPCPKLLSLGGV